MLMKVYVLIWFVTAAIAVGLYLTGNFNDLWFAIFAFFFSTLFSLSFVAVLPWWLSRPFSPGR